MTLPATIESSFFLPFELLTGSRRFAFRALYHYCRTVDDGVDGPVSAADARAHLLFWHDELERMYDGMPTHPVALALQPHIRTYNLSHTHFRDMLAGFEMDYSGIMRKPGLEVLNLYCYRVASTVGLLCCEIMGCTQSSSRQFAIQLGKAVQLVNILRDIAEDADQNRIYLPRELLQRYGLDHASANTLLAHGDALRSVCAALADRAYDHFRQASLLVHRQDRPRLLPALIMRDIYMRLLEKLEQAGWLLPQGEKARVTKPEQWVLLITGLRHRFLS